MEVKNKFQTTISIEEQHLAAMSSITTKIGATTRKFTKKTTLKAMSSTHSTEEVGQQQHQQIFDADSQNESVVQLKNKPTKKKISIADTATKTTTTTMSTTSAEHVHQASTLTEQGQLLEQTSLPTGDELTNGKKKVKGKKSKKGETDQQNISVKSSLTKFDALQKRNLIHNPQGEKEINCRLCAKPVYKMEEIKAEKSIFHKNCFRCQECNKQLKVDNYQSHEGVLYCTVHFKSLFAPKCVEDSEPEKPRKPELIIRENQPTELPPDVIRASDKPDLGLEELQQLNVRSRFQVFENPARSDSRGSDEPAQPARSSVRHSSSILSKLAKLQSQGVSTDLSNKALATQVRDAESSADEEGEEATHSDTDDGSDADAALVRCKRSTKRERPVGLGHAMHDIKTKFEKGHLMTKEERREERKQEIQNIRSRLFMGKQARMKELYQEAVAESEQAITASSKKPEIEIEGAARSIKERFEKGEVFKDNAHNDNEEDGGPRSAGIHNEADVFESAISKKSRSIFMELDANVVAGKNQANTPNRPAPIKQLPYSFNRHNSENEPEHSTTSQQIDVVKCDEKPEDVKIETSELSSKFKFFETYRPTERQKREFRITPPREGVVKMPTPDSETDNKATTHEPDDTNILEKSHTTAMMLNKFREMEQNKSKGGSQAGPRPLKAFTPPPDDGKRVFQEQESDVGSQDDEDDDEENEEDDESYYRRSNTHLNDEALKEAQAAARAKQLRAKFEKWEATEKQRELNEGRVDIYSQQVSDDSNIESTKTIRERFENMEHAGKHAQSTRPRYKVNRFV